MLKSFVQRIARAGGLHIETQRAVPWGAYKYLDIKALAGDTVGTAFDVGANEGQTVAALRAHFPRAKVFAFEPIEETFARLKAATDAYDNVTCIQLALGAEATVMNMTSSSNGQNTLVSGIRRGEHRVSVNVQTLDSFCASSDVAVIDLLKVDTEGFEMEVLKGGASMIGAGAVRFILAECDFVRRRDEPHGDFFEIATYLFSHGYRLVATYPHGVDGDGWRWGDALFMLPAKTPVACSPYELLG